MLADRSSRQFALTCLYLLTLAGLLLAGDPQGECRGGDEATLCHSQSRDPGQVPAAGLLPGPRGNVSVTLWDIP